MRWVKWVSITLGGILLLLIIAIVVVTQTPLLARFANSRLNAAIPDEVPLNLKVGKIIGPTFDGVRIQDVVLKTAGTESDTVAYCSAIQVSFDLLELLGGTFSFGQVILDSLVVDAPTDSTIATWMKALPKGDGEGPSTPLDISIENAIIRAHRIQFASHQEWTVSDLVAKGHIALAGNDLEFSVGRFTAVLPKKDSTYLTAWVQGQKSPAGVSLDSAYVATQSSYVSAGGTINPGDTLNIHQAHVSLEELKTLLGINIRGAADYSGILILGPGGVSGGAGKLSGTLEDRKIQGVEIAFTQEKGDVRFQRFRGTAVGAAFNGSGYLDFSASPPSYGYSGTIRGFNLNNVVPETFTTDLSGSLTLDGESFEQDELQMQLDVELSRSNFDAYEITSARGKMQVDTKHVEFATGFQLGYYQTIAEIEGNIWFSDSIDAFANVYLENLRDYEGQTFIDSLAGRGYAYLSLTGRASSPDVAGRFESDSLRLFDLRSADFVGNFQIDDVFDSRQGAAEMTWSDAVGWQVPIDSLYTMLTFDGFDVIIDSAMAMFPGFSMQVGGRLNWEADTLPINLFPIAGGFNDERFHVADTVFWTIDTLGFSFEPFKVIGDHVELEAAGRIDFDTRMDFILVVDELNFTPYRERFFPEMDVGGYLHILTELQGTFAEPQIRGNGWTTNLTYLGENIGEIEGSFVYADGEIQFDSLSLVHDDWSLAGEGTFPLDLSFGEVKQRIPDRPQKFSLSGSGTALTPATWLLPDILERIEGAWELSIDVAGSPQAPRFSGQGHLLNGAIKTVEIQNEFRDVAMGLELHHDTIHVLYATGRVEGQERRHGIEGSGTIIIKSIENFVYNLRLRGTEVPARFAFQESRVVADLDLSVVGSTPPEISGDIQILEGEYREPFAYEDRIVLPDTTQWDWDINATCDGNFWIHNDQTDAEVKFDVRLQREYGVLSVLGSAELVPGRSRVYIFGREGRIEKSNLIFDQPESIDPRLDMKISFRISRATSVGDEGDGTETEFARDVTLTLQVTGRASEPVIQSAAGSPYSEQDILILLAANRSATAGTGNGNSGLYDRLRVGAAKLLFREMEKNVARTLGISTFNVNPGESTEETEVTVGTYFLRNFYVYGSSTVGFERGQEVGFEYRFGEGIYLDGRYDRFNQYRLNLHFFYEYK